MSSKIKKEVFLWSVAVCFAFGYNTSMASTHFACNTVYTQLTNASNGAKVFFEAEKIYSVNFQDRSPRYASQATHDYFMTTWTNKISISSERISRKLRGFDQLRTSFYRTNINMVSYGISYLTNTLIYSAQNFKTSNLIANNLNFTSLPANSKHKNLLTTHSPHGAGNSFC